jgi:hypothetical protein
MRPSWVTTRAGALTALAGADEASSCMARSVTGLARQAPRRLCALAAPAASRPGTSSKPGAARRATNRPDRALSPAVPGQPLRGEPPAAVQHNGVFCTVPAVAPLRCAWCRHRYGPAALRALRVCRTPVMSGAHSAAANTEVRAAAPQASRSGACSAGLTSTSPRPPGQAAPFLPSAPAARGLPGVCGCAAGIEARRCARDHKAPSTDPDSVAPCSPRQGFGLRPAARP